MSQETLPFSEVSAALVVVCVCVCVCTRFSLHSLTQIEPSVKTQIGEVSPLFVPLYTQFIVPFGRLRLQLVRSRGRQAD